MVQAAAHGVPTVATKNGGPVDIMQTLHHGILVDPTNSKAIADALLRILTNSSLWDEYSHNGVPLAPVPLCFMFTYDDTRQGLACCCVCCLPGHWQGPSQGISTC